MTIETRRRTYFDLVRLCGRFVRTDRWEDFFGEAASMPAFLHREPFEAAVTACIEARRNLIQELRMDHGFDALAWDRALSTDMARYFDVLLWNIFEAEPWPGAPEETLLADLRAMMTEAETEPETQALRRAAEARWSPDPG